MIEETEIEKLLRKQAASIVAKAAPVEAAAEAELEDDAPDLEAETPEDGDE